MSRMRNEKLAQTSGRGSDWELGERGLDSGRAEFSTPDVALAWRKIILAALEALSSYIAVCAIASAVCKR